MTQEEKQLLLRDLCARLPYGVKLDNGLKLRSIDTLTQIVSCSGSDKKIDCIKPYLRPMSSMTEEEEKVFNDFLEFQAEYVSDADLYNKTDMYDWLLANHFDYRIDPSTGKTLIESGLALEAPEGMYKND